MVDLRRVALPALALSSVLSAGCTLGGVKGTFPAVESLAPSDNGRLRAAADAIAAELDGDHSAFWLLDRADFSFEARLALVDRATESLDIQYFIWEKDPTSRLFAHRIALAAERGVRVRILLDDLTLNGQDAEYYGLDGHPNIEVRTYNPWNRRSNLGRVAEWMFRFGKLNHRMHNKIVTADGHFSIIGGRNIGDRYFGLWDAFVQNDLDLLIAGPLVEEVADSFDQYWNSTESFPLEAVIGRRSVRQSFADTHRFVIDFFRSHEDRLSYYPLEPISWDGFFDQIQSSYAPGRVEYVYDDPEVGEVDPVDLIDPFNAFIGQATESVVISSPYLVPDDEFVDLLAGLEGRGVDVVILTNSLASNNHMIAHSAYERVRRKLLRLGVELYESRDDSATIDYYTTPPAMPLFLGLHTKAAVVDGRYSYVGSANIDPRSLELNTELAVFIEGTELAARVLALIERDMAPDAAWKVTLEGRRKLKWTSSAGTVYRQPALGFGQRLAEFFVGLLPIKKQS